MSRARSGGGGWGRWWGPVFEAERVTRARRWQGYALRALFVLALLVGVILAGLSFVEQHNGRVTVRELAALGAELAATLNILELLAVLAIAPASTAGAICLDRTRGSLAHLFTTDLSDREIVLGKLAARLGPVLMLLLASFPVAAAATWLGGVDPVSLTLAALVIGSLAVLGCTLALMLSVWGQKPQEVLSVVYGIWAVWLLALPVWDILTRGSGPALLEWSNPFFLTVSPGNYPTRDFVTPSLIFSATCLALGAVFTTIAVWKVRIVACRTPHARSALGQRRWPLGDRLRAQRSARRAWSWPWQREPSLDANPILWREWRRSRGSRWSRWIWGSLRAISFLLGTYLALQALTDFGTARPSGSAGLILAFLAVVGLLLIAVAVPAVLSDERAQGSLDVLLCAPVSTRAILAAKWRGAFRPVPRLTRWPFLIGVLYLLQLHPLRWSGAGLVLMVPVVIVAQGAALVSLGLLLATVITRTAVATAWTVGVLVVVVVGLPIVGSYLPVPLGPSKDPFWATVNDIIIALASPFVNVALAFIAAINQSRGGGMPDSSAILSLLLGWTAVYAGLAWGLFEVTVRVFDRCLGRLPERSLHAEGEAQPPSEAGVGELLEGEIDRLAVPG